MLAPFQQLDHAKRLHEAGGEARRKLREWHEKNMPDLLATLREGMALTQGVAVADAHWRQARQRLMSRQPDAVAALGTYGTRDDPTLWHQLIGTMMSDADHDAKNVNIHQDPGLVIGGTR